MNEVRTGVFAQSGRLHLSPSKSDRGERNDLANISTASRLRLFQSASTSSRLAQISHSSSDAGRQFPRRTHFGGRWRPSPPAGVEGLSAPGGRFCSRSCASGGRSRARFRERTRRPRNFPWAISRGAGRSARPFRVGLLVNKLLKRVVHTRCPCTKNLTVASEENYVEPMVSPAYLHSGRGHGIVVSSFPQVRAASR